MKPVNYIKANAFIKCLKNYRYVLSSQQLRTLKGQALKGDIRGAEKGLDKMLLEAGV